MLFRVTLDGTISGVLDEEVRRAPTRQWPRCSSSGVYDPAIHLDSIDGSIMISCAVEVADFEDAIPPASVKIRTVLHSANIGTPRAKNHDAQWTVEFIKSQTEKVVVLGDNTVTVSSREDVRTTERRPAYPELDRGLSDDDDVVREDLAEHFVDLPGRRFAHGRVRRTWP